MLTNSPLMIVSSTRSTRLARDGVEALIRGGEVGEVAVGFGLYGREAAADELGLAHFGGPKKVRGLCDRSGL